jgi:hypothetical protein
MYQISDIRFDAGSLRAEKARRYATVESLAAHLKHSPTTIINALHGRDNVRLGTLRRIAARLGLRVEVTFSPIGAGCARCDGTGIVSDGYADHSFPTECVCVDGSPVTEEEIPL